MRVASAQPRAAMGAPGGLTYAHGLVYGLAVGMVVLVVRISALLAREGVSALSGSSCCCPAEGLHCVVGGPMVL